MRIMPSNNKATILISALWIVAILTIFAVSVGRQSSISLKLTAYNADRLKAFFLARAGMLRALSEKALEIKSNRTATIDALSQSWANNKELFDNRPFGDGNYTVAYEHLLKIGEGQKATRLYGLMDEQSKININVAEKETIANLIALSGVDTARSQEIASAVIDWRDEDSDTTTSEDDFFNGAEDDYYLMLDNAYACKNSLFEAIYELTLVRGMTLEIFSKIEPYITVYGDGKININTAAEPVLEALFGPDFPYLAPKIARYRRGGDDIIGTEDDRWFCIGSYVVDRKDKGLVEIKNLQDGEWYANIYGITTEEYNRIKSFVAGPRPQVCASSNTYRVLATGDVKKVKVNIEAVYSFNRDTELPVVEYWFEG